VSDLQTDVSVVGNNITGTLNHYDTSSQLVDYWGEGNFLAMKVKGITEAMTSVKVGLRPTYGGPGGTTPIDDDSGLVEISDDPDKNFAAFINDKDTQKLILLTTDGTTTIRKEYDLSTLVCL
jgi:hypothetical protein